MVGGLPVRRLIAWAAVVSSAALALVLVVAATASADAVAPLNFDVTLPLVLVDFGGSPHGGAADWQGRDSVRFLGRSVYRVSEIHSDTDEPCDLTVEQPGPPFCHYFDQRLHVVFTAANGDELVLDGQFSEVLAESETGVGPVIESTQHSWQVTSGTGRLAGFTGSGTYALVFGPPWVLQLSGSLHPS